MGKRTSATWFCTVSSKNCAEDPANNLIAVANNTCQTSLLSIQPTTKQHKQNQNCQCVPHMQHFKRNKPPNGGYIIWRIDKIVFNKKIITIALILMLTATSSLLIALPTANAAVEQWDTFAYVIATPNPVQVNTPLVVSFRIDKTNPLALIRTNLFTGFTVQITKPDGTTETKGPYTADSTSGSWFQYTPTTVGTYKFQTFFAGQWANRTGAGSYERWYKPSQSSILQVTVQQDPIPTYDKSPPLPTDYWTRPINAENKGWWQIADNWLMQGYDRTGWSTHSTTVFAPYTSGPETPHVLWTRSIDFGGIVGGQFGDKVFRTGLSYEQYYSPIILGGRIIYNEHGSATSSDVFGTRCIDLYTGEEIWYLDEVTIDFAQTLDFNSGNEHGLITCMWSTSGNNWTNYDAWSGEKLFTITNMTGLTGTTTFGPNGEVVSYLMGGNATNRWISMWNSTKAIVGLIADYYSPRVGSIYNGRNGIEWNVTVPDVPGTQSITLIGEGYALATVIDETVYPNVYQEMVYDLNAIKKDNNGNYPASINHLWIANRTAQYYGASNAIRTTNTINSGVYARYDQATMKVTAFDIKTGAKLWQSTELPGGGWANFERSWTIAYGIVFGSGMDGHIYAWDAKTGAMKWDYYFGSAGYENAYGAYPVYNGYTVADGKVYVCNDEHSPDAVMWRGGRLYCIDAYTGEGLWNISGWLRHAVISDGLLTSNNVLDMKIYTIGKGPSQTTVSAPQSAVTVGSPIAITGTVTDQSPSAKGTPAIADLYMSAWMEYLHMQKTFPANATGVPIKIMAIDPSGNPVDIGTVTSDNSGSYGIAFTPTMEGKYQIKATFEGTQAYGDSSATAYLVVGPAIQSSVTTPTVAPTQTPTAPTTTTPVSTSTASPSAIVEPGTGISTETLLIIGAAIIIIAVVAAAAVLLRKRA